MMILKPQHSHLHFIDNLKYIREFLVDLKKDKKIQENLQRQVKKQQFESIVENGDHSAEQFCIQKKTEKNNLSNQQNNKKNQKQQNNIKKQIRQYHTQINEIGQELEDLQTQIQSYEIIFDNLCQCYAANIHKVHKNTKLKKQSRRLAEQALKIRQQIQKTESEIAEIENQQTLMAQSIKQGVYEYVGQLLRYNKVPEQLVIPQICYKYENLGLDTKQQESEEEEEYQQIVFNFEQMKKLKEENKKKKQINAGPRLQKNISFQDDMDVMNHYFQSELNDI